MIRLRVTLLLALVAASVSGPAAQQTGVIHGRVDVRLPAQVVEQHPDVMSLNGRSHRPAPDRRRAVVYLESAPLSAFEIRRRDRVRMDQRDEAFVPHVLAVSVGTTVDFTNNDTTYHNVFSLSRTRPFDLGRYAAGKAKSITFDRPGIVRVFCDIHSHMSAFILVFNHRFFAVTDGEGRYRIDGIPPGNYTLRVWNEVVTGTSRAVSVTAGGDVEAPFVLERSGGA